MSNLKYSTCVGDKFGSWSVLDANVKNSKSLVRCVCGLEKLVRNADLISGRSRSCGKGVCRSDFIDLSGLRFGFLLINQKTDIRSSNGSVVWQCSCICGKQIFVSSKHLLSGSTKSCGCKKMVLRYNSVKLLPQDERVIRSIFDTYKRGARKRGLEFLLDRESFDDLIKSNCFYCNAVPAQLKLIKRIVDTISFSYNGIDRLDPNLGYIIGNCVPCCWICNRAKSNLVYGDFVTWIDNLVKFKTGNKMIYELSQVSNEEMNCNTQ